MLRFFDQLSHRTKIMLISCISFILLAMLILIFLMICPIHIESNANNANDDLIVTDTVTQMVENDEIEEVSEG